MSNSPYSDAIQVQQKYAPNLDPKIIESAMILAEDVVRQMKDHIPHISQKNLGRAKSTNAHQYWMAYFEYYRPNVTTEYIPAGFGYDLRQWKGTNRIPNPPWRVLLYKSSHLSAIQECVTRRYPNLKDEFSDDPPFDDLKLGEYLWLPVPSEFVRGVTIAPLLAGAVNAFLGDIIQ